MKKNLFFQILLLGSLVLVVPLSCFAQATFDLDLESPITVPGGDTNLQNAIGMIINLLFAIAAVVALIFLIIGGYQYLMSGGNPETQEAAKKTMGNAIVGLIAILISYLVITFLLGQLHVTDTVIW